MFLFISLKWIWKYDENLNKVTDFVYFYYALILSGCEFFIKINDKRL